MTMEYKGLVPYLFYDDASLAPCGHLPLMA
jgi:hypothetical protein